MENLTNENFLLVAAKQYWSIHYTVLEFDSDIKRIMYIKRLIKRYNNTGVLPERLILNHLILLFNTFEPSDFVAKMLFLKLDKSQFSVIKTFLVYLNRMPEIININNINTIISSEISIDMNVATLLRLL